MKLIICIFFGHKFTRASRLISEDVAESLPYNECERCKLLGKI